MRAFVGLTNWEWFQFLGARHDVDEVNFWRPSNTRAVSFDPGTPFLFKLHQEHGGWIVGFGHFAGFTARSMWLAWAAFEHKNGAESFGALHRLLAGIRRRHGHESDPAGNYLIGCLLISQPVFFERSRWVSPPTDWPPTGLMGGKSIDIASGEGARVWADCLARVTGTVGDSAHLQAVGEGIPARYGEPVLTRPRLGQGSFKLLVTDAYRGACAVTGEHSLPVLEAAHIRPYAEDGPHDIGNGLLLRTDIHKLFDMGYVTVSPEDHRFLVGRRLRDDYSNGRTYYSLHGREIHLPETRDRFPRREFLEWHARERFRG